MKFELSKNVAVQTTEPDKAKEFYTKILGFKDRSNDPDFGGIDSGLLRIFVQDDKNVSGIVMELFVDDLEEAKKILTENGCKIIRWEGKGKDCYIEDPFGVRFNIWEKK